MDHGIYTIRMRSKKLYVSLLLGISFVFTALPHLLTLVFSGKMFRGMQPPCILRW